MLKKLFLPSRFHGIIALLIVTAVWGTTFPVLKNLTTSFSAPWIMFIRFSFAGLLLSPFLYRAKKNDVMAGCLLGAVLLACYLMQLEGLARTSSNRNAFVTGLSVLVVPLFDLLIGRIPERRILIGMLLATAGLFALCWDGSAWGTGDNYALCGAFFWGLYIKLMEVTTRRVSNWVALTAVQIITMATCAGLWLWLGAQEHLIWSNPWAGIGEHAWDFVYLSFVATLCIMVLQAWGQRRTSANEAAVIFALEPACAAMAAYFWLQEVMTWRGVFGGLLMIVGIVISQWRSIERKLKSD